jgi:phospholipid transport system substrate-binding protein
MFTIKTSTLVSRLFAASLLLLSSTLFAEQIVRDDAAQMLKQTTDILLTSAKNSKSNIDKDKQRYYNEVEVVLNQVIDKEYFARGVMATYASARQYNALKTDAEREAFRNRVSKFSDAMQIALIEKYADVLLLFDGGKIDYENLKQDAPDGSKVNLKQLVHNKNGETYIIQYNLHKDKQGKWLVYNFIVEGVNLGSTYRSQFAEAVEKNKNNVDYVVANWASILSQGARE